MTKKFVLYSMALVLPFAPIATQAATGDALLENVDAWEEFSTSLQKDEQELMLEEQFQSSAELFPELDNSTSKSQLERVTDERRSQFVTVEIDGKTVSFLDVPQTAWFAPFVRVIAEKRIVSGYRDAVGRATGMFGPGDSVTIEQMAKVMLYSAGVSIDDCSKNLPLNISAHRTWSEPFIACAESLNWILYSDGTVDLHRPATRAEVIATLLQAFNQRQHQPTGKIFSDVSEGTQFAGAIETAKEAGIISGYTDIHGVPKGTFGPLDSVTRAEFAKIMTIGMEKYVK